MDKAEKEVLGQAAKVVLTKDTTTIVGDGSTQEAVNKRVAQIKNLVEVLLVNPFSPHITIFTCLAFSLVINVLHMQATEQDYEKEKLNERIAKLSGGVAVIQVNLGLA